MNGCVCGKLCADIEIMPVPFWLRNWPSNLWIACQAKQRLCPFHFFARVCVGLLRV